MSPSWLEAFSDGVIAILITVTPVFLAYLLSLVNLAIYTFPG
jgi:uncharacterized membrane protein